MDIGEPLEVIEVVPEPAVPYEGDEIPSEEPEHAPSESEPETVPAHAHTTESKNHESSDNPEGGAP